MKNKKLVVEQKRAILYDVVLPHMNKIDAKKRVDETENLLKTYGGLILLKIVQKRDHPGSTSFVGREKMIEIVEECQTLGANLIILNDSLKNSQIYKIEAYMDENEIKGIEVWDRVELILRIFSLRAHTTIAKYQLELAKIEHMGPRIYRMGLELSQQGGGIGTRGAGETNTEMMRRHLGRYKKSIKTKLDKLKISRDINKKRRKKIGFKNISIVGYTNSGKSSLFELLTKKETYIKDELFATLDTKVGKIYLPQLEESVVVTDTIGFIRHLPTELIGAFKSTLEEAMDADLLIHLVDLSDEDYLEKIQIVDQILGEIGRREIPVLYVFNKVDKVENIEEKRLKIPPHVVYCLISVREKRGIDELKKHIVRLFLDMLYPSPKEVGVGDGS